MPSKKTNKLTLSQEDYLQAIFQITQVNQVARVKDISKALNIGASSVSEALKILGEKKLINYVPYGFITLTDKGKAIAEDLNKDQEVIKSFLIDVLQVSELDAASNADSIVHNISVDVLSKFVRFLKFMQTCPCKEPKWMRGYQAYIKEGTLDERCQQCIAFCTEKGITKPLTDISYADLGHRCCGATND